MKDPQEIVPLMTLEEKASFCAGLDFWYLKGIERLGIPSIMLTDGPHGLRKQEGDPANAGLDESIPATCFPTASALAATWNRDLVCRIGEALGDECRQEKVGVILGPGINIKRSPLCGRNFEYFSEDPCLSGEMAASYINGVQSRGVGTSLKHYAANNQEYRRMTIDTIVDERALREVYLAGFEIAVRKAQPWTVMCAYNKINGTYACENDYLVKTILKEEWGHEGLVVTDWGAMNERVAALQAGVELEMPGVNNGNEAIITAAVRGGALDEAVLDRAVERIMTLIFKAAENLKSDHCYDPEEHHALACIAAAEGAVLLKNDQELLPLQEGMKIALLGRFATEPRYQGAGSSLINPTRVDNLYAELVKLVGENNVTYLHGYGVGGEEADEALLNEALAAAAAADVAIVCAGLTELNEVEGVDRRHMKLPAGHDALIEKIASKHDRVVVVLSNGAPVEMPWAGRVGAILEGYLGGQAGAGATADILTGRVNPSGKLAETFPLRLEDCPAKPFPGGPAAVEYRESIFVGYRYYDTAGLEVLYPFGHGLSYTTFDYRDLLLKVKGNTVEVALKVKNSGKMKGKETVQLYVRDPEASVFRPLKELKAFTKLELEPGEEKEISFVLDTRAFAYYDSALKNWVVEAGEFEIMAGASSRDIRLKAAVQLGSDDEDASQGERREPASYFTISGKGRFGEKDFAALLGRSLPPNQPPQKGEYDLNTPLCELGDSFWGRQFIKIVEGRVGKLIRGREQTPTAVMMRTMIAEMPLRGLLMQGGLLSRPGLEALLLIFNGHFYKGLKALIRARLRR